MRGELRKNPVRGDRQEFPGCARGGDGGVSMTRPWLEGNEALNDGWAGMVDGLSGVVDVDRTPGAQVELSGVRDKCVWQFGERIELTGEIIPVVVQAIDGIRGVRGV